ncbi:MAG: ABC transporter substrate-binding protein [Chloroflexi bacterium]|nr:ABC transporter substrate-binding protein [Chloroflexota bacterium]
MKLPKQHPLILTLSLIILILSLAACTPTPTNRAPSAATATETPNPQPATRDVILSMGFIPNVQFAPFYVALEKGYFAEEGINLQFDYGMESDLLKLVGTGSRAFVVGSGDQVLLARSQGLPVVYVMNWYRKFPIAVVALQDWLKRPADLEGRKVGIPGLFGASYVGWQALVYATGLDEQKVQLETVGFTQIPSLTEGKVDAAVVYAANEPLQLRRAGYKPSVLYVSDYVDLVANGLITNEETIANDPELVQGMVRASLRGLADTLADPEAAFELTLRYVPEAGGENREAQMAVLKETLGFWKSDTLGMSSAQAWTASEAFMRKSGLLTTDVAVDKAYTNRFVQ